MKKAEIQKVFGTSAYAQLNQKLIKDYGIDVALMLSELKYQSDYFHTKSGWFVSTVSNVKKKLPLSQYKQQQAVNTLIDLGYIESDLHTAGRRRRFRLTEKVYTLSSNYIIVNKMLASKFGVNEAIIISETISATTIKKVDVAEEVQVSVEFITNGTGLSAKQQRTAIKHLVEANLIKVTYSNVYSEYGDCSKDVVNGRFIQLNVKEILKIINSDKNYSF